ncbi:MAG: UvrD-helicase domain-containing protein, partial [Clostridiales bacterium]|nr:UvrD-helicase domain-containing protein [Clostridiales bacterium]
MSNKWTNDQKNAIDLHNRNILVSAAAGSGKTAVLVERIIESIVKRGLDIDRLVVVTFTRAAASEMKDRIRRRFEEILRSDPLNKRIYSQLTLLQDAQITTIDSFCLNIIRTHFEEAGADPGFRVAETGEIRLLETDTFNEVIEEFYEEAAPDFLDFVSSFSGDKNDARIEEMVMKLYYSAVNNPWPDEWLGRISEVYDFDLDEYKSRMAEFC